MAVDRLGQTVVADQVYVLAGTCRRIDGDQVVLVVGLNGEHAIRVKAGDLQKADHLVNLVQAPIGNGGAVFNFAPSATVAASVGAHLVRLQEVNDLFNLLTTTFLGYLAGKQDLDAELTALAGLVSAADKMPYFTGSGTAALATVTSFMRTVLDDTTAGAACTTLGASQVGHGHDASEIAVNTDNFDKGLAGFTPGGSLQDLLDYLDEILPA